jgi:hypothetical protein
LSISFNKRAASDGHAARSAQEPAQVRRETLLKANVRPPSDDQLSLQQLERHGLQQRRRRGLVHEVETGLARCGDHFGHAVHQLSGRHRLINSDVIQGDVAKRATRPVTAMRQRHLVPPAIRPKRVHRIRLLNRIDVLHHRQALVVRGPSIGEFHIR